MRRGVERAGFFAKTLKISAFGVRALAIIYIKSPIDFRAVWAQAAGFS